LIALAGHAKKENGMKAGAVLAVVGLLALPLSAAAETWKNVSIVDTMCATKVKADPDKHTTSCALQCEKGGYGLFTADGSYLKFDKAGNDKTVAALKATKKTDHLRATVDGQRDGETVKVTSIALD
jgi:hypothetical protein